MDIPASNRPVGSSEPTVKASAPVAGAICFNRYKLERVLGRGAMGIVWMAEDMKLERTVALKFLPHLLGFNSTALKELKSETRRGLELSHPNIVRIYDFVDDDENAAIAMEYIEGRTLSDLRAATQHGVLSVAQVARWLPDVCGALDYAHLMRKVVHRDLKPANIMICNVDEAAKIADFGIARSISDTMSRFSASQFSVSGTLPYMSPQQALGDRPSPTDDVYSLGATLYELLTGKPPFYRGDIAIQMSVKVPSRIAERRQELGIKADDVIPQQWESVIAACLDKDPARRPPSAGRLIELLGLAPPAIAVVAHETASASTSLPPPKRRVPIWAAAAALTVALAISALVFNARSPVGSATEQPGRDATAIERPVEVPSMTPAPIPDPVLSQPAPVPPSPPAMTAAVQPPGGFWPLAEIFPAPPQAVYSENGRRKLLYQAQGLLKGLELYNAVQDGKEGIATHSAIVLFQAKNGLLTNGLLDTATLAAMALITEPDDPFWRLPASGQRSKSASKDKPNMLERVGSSIGKLFGRD